MKLQLQPAIRRLQKAFEQGNLTLFLGAGCSVASGVPDWRKLVVELYMNGIARRLRRHCRIPGLVPAVSAWTFAKGGVPLEVGARHLRGFYHSDEALLDLMRGMIYGQTGYYDRGHEALAFDLGGIGVRPGRIIRAADLYQQSI